MCLWQKLWDRIAVIDPFDGAIPVVAPKDPYGFSISLLALFAKLAKADGQITRDEVRRVRVILQIAPEDERAAGRVFDLCGQDPSGHEAYARRISRAIGTGAGADELRADVIEAMFMVAMADGSMHPDERKMIDTTARALALGEDRLQSIAARHDPEAHDPWRVLGLEAGADAHDVRRAWRDLVKREHPDKALARGLPPAMIAVAHQRLTEINRAYRALTAPCAPVPAP